MRTVLAALVGSALSLALFAQSSQDREATSPGESKAAPILVTSVMPVYPPIARSARVRGTAIVDAMVEIDGRVASVKVVRSIPLLDRAAIAAVQQWRFTPSERATTIRVTLRFTINDPALYPRPSTFNSGPPSWVPANFAFTYSYECRRTSVSIDSIVRTVSNTAGRLAKPTRIGFGFDGGQAEEVFVLLVGAGFFDPSEKGAREWNEVPFAESGVSQRGGEVFATVTESPSLDGNAATPQQGSSIFGGDGRSFSHTLAARRGDRWKLIRWSEPVDDDSWAAPLAAAGKRIRELVRNSLVAGVDTPTCL